MLLALLVSFTAGLSYYSTRLLCMVGVRSSTKFPSSIINSLLEGTGVSVKSSACYSGLQ